MEEGPARIAWRSYQDWVLPVRAVRLLLTFALFCVFVGMVIMAVGGALHMSKLIVGGAVVAAVGGCCLFLCLFFCLHAYCVFRVRDQTTQTDEILWLEEKEKTPRFDSAPLSLTQTLNPPDCSTPFPVPPYLRTADSRVISKPLAINTSDFTPFPAPPASKTSDGNPASFPVSIKTSEPTSSLPNANKESSPSPLPSALKPSDSTLRRQAGEAKKSVTYSREVQCYSAENSPTPSLSTNSLESSVFGTLDREGRVGGRESEGVGRSNKQQYSSSSTYHSNSVGNNLRQQLNISDYDVPVERTPMLPPSSHFRPPQEVKHRSVMSAGTEVSKPSASKKSSQLLLEPKSSAKTCDYDNIFD